MSPEKLLSSRDDFFLNQAGKESLDYPRLIQETKSFLEQAENSPDLEGEALTAILLRDYFEGELPFLYLKRIRNMIGRAYGKSRVLGEYLATLGMMSKTVHEFFRWQEEAYGYWVPGKFSHPLSEKLLHLHGKDLVKVKMDEFQKKGQREFLIELFPPDHTFGIWMSIQGIRFDPSKVPFVPQPGIEPG